MNVFDLTGLKPHHPLGFMAACGLFRCLTESKDLGWVKLGWRLEGGEDTFAVLYAERLLDIDTIARMMLRVAETKRNSRAWTWSEKVDDRARYRETSQAVVAELFSGAATACEDAGMLAALGSDLISKRNKGKGVLQATGFDCTSANQRLLKGLVGIADWSEHRKAKEALARATVEGVEARVDKAQAKVDDALKKVRDQFEEALKGPWRYQNDHHSLGWDPQGQRLHALRSKAPTNDTARRSVRAAVFLASLALPMFPCFAIGGRLRTTGFHRDDDHDWFAWPVWREPISLPALRSLLFQSFDHDLEQRGVNVVYRSRVAHTGGSQGDYKIFSHPEERAWVRLGGVSRRRDSIDAPPQRR